MPLLLAFDDLTVSIRSVHVYSISAELQTPLERSSRLDSSQIGGSRRLVHRIILILGSPPQFHSVPFSPLSLCANCASDRRARVEALGAGVKTAVSRDGWGARAGVRHSSAASASARSWHKWARLIVQQWNDGDARRSLRDTSAPTDAYQSRGVNSSALQIILTTIILIVVVQCTTNFSFASCDCCGMCFAL